MINCVKQKSYAIDRMDKIKKYQSNPAKSHPKDRSSPTTNPIMSLLP